jgi:hypothetical protein
VAITVSVGDFFVDVLREDDVVEGDGWVWSYGLLAVLTFDAAFLRTAAV